MPTAFHLELALYTAVLPGIVALIFLLEHEVRLWLRNRADSASPATPAPVPVTPPAGQPQDFPSLLRALRAGPSPLDSPAASPRPAPWLPLPSLNVGLAIGLGVITAFIFLDGFPGSDVWWTYFRRLNNAISNMQAIPLPPIGRSTEIVAIAILGGGLLGYSLAKRPGFLAVLARPRTEPAASDAGSGSASSSPAAPSYWAALPRAANIALLGGGLMLAQVLRNIPIYWDAPEWIAFISILAGWILLTIALDLASSTPAACGWWVPLVFTIAFGMAAALLALVGAVAIYAQLAIAAAAVCFVAYLIGIWRGTFLFGPGGTLACMVALGTLALNCNFYGGNEFPVRTALLMTAAPAGLLLILLPRMAGHGRWAALLLAILLPGVPLALFLLNKAPDNAYGY